MEKICKNCKFYDPPKTNDGKVEDIGWCNSNKLVYVDDDSFPMDDKLGVWDNNELKSVFFVGSNFGCIHFQPKS